MILRRSDHFIRWLVTGTLGAATPGVSFLGHLSMIFVAKWQNFCIRKIPMLMLV